MTKKSERVKAIDFHPTEPWIAVGLYNGTLAVHNYQTKAAVKTIPVCTVPSIPLFLVFGMRLTHTHTHSISVRCARFVARKNWIIIGSDDNLIRIYNYNTAERVHTVEGHADYIRSISVHPVRSLFLSTSDDCTCKLWDWDAQGGAQAGVKCINSFEGHQHYVMQAAFNPKDPNTFATCSLDRTVKIWSLTGKTASYTMDGHAKGVNAIAFYQGKDRPYLVTGSDDHTVRVWDYQSRQCVHVLQGHSQNVSSVSFHPRLPLLLSASEDGAVRLWGTGSFRCELVVNAGLDRLWSICVSEQNGEIGLGGDFGFSVMALGRGEPAVAMDLNNGKLVWVHEGNQICTGRVEENGAICLRQSTARKDLGQSDFSPNQLQYAPNGRFVTVIGDGEWCVYTAVAWRNRAFGKASEFQWAASEVGNNVYVTRQGNTISVFEDFEPCGQIVVDSSIQVDRMYGGGRVLAVVGSGHVLVYDYRSGDLLQAIEQDVFAVSFGDGLMALSAIPKGLYVINTSDFSVLYKAVDVRLRSPGLFLDGNTFAFQDSDSLKIAYCLFDPVKQSSVHEHIASSNTVVYPLGWYDEHLWFVDKDYSTHSYKVPVKLLECQQLVLGNKVDQAVAVSKNDINSPEVLNKLARFMEACGHAESALILATDPSLLFSVYLKLEKLKDAYQLLSKAPLSPDSRKKWRLLGEAMVRSGNSIDKAAECFLKANEIGNALLLGCLSEDHETLNSLRTTTPSSQPNASFMAAYVLRDYEHCFNLLMQQGRYPEAAMFSQSHGLPLTELAVREWNRVKPNGLFADPVNHPDMFPTNSVSNQLNNMTVTSRKNYPRKGSVKSTASYDDDLMSVEVNTTGTGSIKVDYFDDCAVDDACDDGNTVDVNNERPLSTIDDLSECHIEDEDRCEEMNNGEDCHKEDKYIEDDAVDIDTNADGW